MLITGVVMVIATVPLFHAMTVWAVALERQFGWSRTQLGLALTLTRVESGLIGPLEGYLVDKVGTRRMVLIGLVILGGAWIFFSRVENLWMFYAAYVLMAVGQGLGSWIPLMTMLNKWFVRRRSSAIGWANVVSRFGALLLVPATAWAVADAPGRIGWQMTALILGIGILVLAGPLASLIRNDPKDYGEVPDGERMRPAASAGSAPSQPRQQELSATEAPTHPGLLADRLRTRFYLHGNPRHYDPSGAAHGGLRLFGGVRRTGGVGIHRRRHVLPTGGRIRRRPDVQAGRSGLLHDGAGGRGSGAGYFQDPADVLVFGVLFGAGFGGRNPLTVAIRADYFGTANFGKILGFSTVPMNILLLIASPFAGWMYDATEPTSWPS